jgi:hypothetical protein
MKSLLLAILLLWSVPAFAQFQKPPGLTLPTVMVPDYNLTISVWAFDTAIVGQYIGVYELHNDGLWYGCVNNPRPSTNFDADVTAAGGANAWLATVGRGQINEALALCYPPITGIPGPPPPPTAGVVALVNYGLQSFKLVVTNGLPVMAGK